LASVEIDFKTTIAWAIGFSVNLLIFKFGTSVKREYLHDLNFSYQPKPPNFDLLGLDKKPVALKDALSKAIQEAAQAKKDADEEARKAGWEIKQVAVTIQFGVTWDGNASANIPISLVTIGPNVDISKASVHSAKVTFGKAK
jgi:hypothetical protein